METVGFVVLALGGMVLAATGVGMALGTGPQRKRARQAARRSRQRELQHRGA